MSECLLITAGRLEGKNDVNARLAGRGLALDLRTEHFATPKQIGNAVQRAIADGALRTQVQRVAHDLRSRDPIDLMAQLSSTTCDASRAPAKPVREGPSQRSP